MARLKAPGAGSEDGRKVVEVGLSVILGGLQCGEMAGKVFQNVVNGLVAPGGAGPPGQHGESGVPVSGVEAPKLQGTVGAEPAG